MCRMMLVKGNFESAINPLMMAFREVSMNDPLNIGPDGSVYSHPDGWGYVNIHDTIEYGRYPQPVFNADGPEVHDGLFMLHARKTSTGEPVGVGFVHPFHAFDAESDYWLPPVFGPAFAIEIVPRSFLLFFENSSLIE